MDAIIWLGIVIVLIIIEIVTLGLTTIWFAGGALAACIAALLGAALPGSVVSGGFGVAASVHAAAGSTVSEPEQDAYQCGEYDRPSGCGAGGH